MRCKWFLGLTAAVILSMFFLLPSAYAAGSSEDELASAVKLALGKSFNTDWSGLDSLTGFKWAPLPPKMLKNCLPDGGCFIRQGSVTMNGRSLVVLATGARTIVSNLYIRNSTTPIGEAAVLAALKQKGFAPELARCPVRGGGGGTNWYRLKGPATNTGVLAIQTSCNGKPCEGFTLTQGEDLPQLQPNQLRLYSEQCTGTAAGRKAVATVMPHEALAQTIASLLPPATGPALYSWQVLPTLAPEAQWSPGGVKKWDLSSQGDPNPMGWSGRITLSGRVLSLLASGSTTDIKAIYFDEQGMHPSGENMLGALYKLGYAVRLRRCGPVYTQSTNNWYSVTSAKSHPVMVQQSIRYEGKQVQDAYVLRLDGTLPTRDPRDRDPGVNGCR